MIKITEIKTDGEQFALGVISALLFQWKFNGNNQTAFALGVASSEEKSLKGEYDMLDAKGGNDTFFRLKSPTAKLRTSVSSVFRPLSPPKTGKATG